MDLKDTFQAVNQMVSDGVIERYAIGGAVGATFYLEPVSTLDVDIFIAFETDPDTLLVSTTPVFSYLKEKGYGMEGEYFIIGGWPVQFLPPTSPLVEEAVRQAVCHEVDEESVYVFSAEHLAAIALEVGRAKDKARLLQFIEVNALDMEAYNTILERYGLAEKWTKFEQLYLEDE